MSAAGRRRRKTVRMQAAEMFERKVKPSDVARLLRVSRKSAHRWQQLWRDGGVQALVSRGPSGSAEWARLRPVRRPGHGCALRIPLRTMSSVRSSRSGRSNGSGSAPIHRMMPEKYPAARSAPAWCGSTSGLTSSWRTPSSMMRVNSVSREGS
ncbi:helix-turn-helix domain-containing protein [Streptomyces sp. NBC_00631]